MAFYHQQPRHCNFVYPVIFRVLCQQQYALRAMKDCVENLQQFYYYNTSSIRQLVQQSWKVLVLALVWTTSFQPSVPIPQTLLLPWVSDQFRLRKRQEYADKLDFEAHTLLLYTTSIINHQLPARRKSICCMRTESESYEQCFPRLLDCCCSKLQYECCKFSKPSFIARNENAFTV